MSDPETAPSPEPAPPLPVPPRARRRRWVLRLGLFTLLVLGGSELALRYALFGSDPVANALGRGVRHESFYAGPREDVFWRLRVVLAGDRVRPHEFADPDLGWTSRRLEPETHAHTRAAEVGERRPILLYGDSFAHCKVPREACWGSLTENSLLAEDHALLNYGVEGYGLDQTVMLLLDTIDDWADREPIVIVSLLLDDDLDRSMLRFRGWSKPQFRIGPEGLERVRLTEAELDPFQAARPVGIRSYLGRLLMASDLMPQDLRGWISGIEAHYERTADLNRRILTLAHQELEARGIEHFFLLFHGERMLAVRDDWREEAVLSTFEDLGAPHVSTRWSFDSDRMRHERPVPTYFLPEGPGVGHYNPLGNEIAFGTIRRGLAGMFDGRSLLVDFADTRQTNLPEEQRDGIYRTGPGTFLEEVQDHWRVVLPCLFGDKPTSLRYAMRGKPARLTFEARTTPETTGRVLLVVRQDEEILERRMLHPGKPRAAFDIALGEPESIAFSVKAMDGASGGVIFSAPWVHH